MYMTTYSEPWRMLDQFRRDIDHYLGNVGNQGDSAIATCAWIPTVDIKECLLALQQN